MPISSDIADPVAAARAALDNAAVAEERVARRLAVASGREYDELRTLQIELVPVTRRARRLYAETLIAKGAAPC